MDEAPLLIYERKLFLGYTSGMKFESAPSRRGDDSIDRTQNRVEHPIFKRPENNCVTMSFEQPLPPHTTPQSETTKLAHGFRELAASPDKNESDVFEILEQDLTEVSYKLADQPQANEILNNNSLICRSESFSRIMNLILEQEPLTITNNGDANMCVMASGSGFRTAMLEGFSGKDVASVVKTVLTFRPSHLTSRSQIPRDSTLWETKPLTAQVSLSGGGEVLQEDVMMVSFRFPIRRFPNRLLSETEKDLLEEDKIQFVVRHYLPDKKETMH